MVTRVGRVRRSGKKRSGLEGCLGKVLSIVLAIWFLIPNMVVSLLTSWPGLRLNQCKRFLSSMELTSRGLSK